MIIFEKSLCDNKLSLMIINYQRQLWLNFSYS